MIEIYKATAREAKQYLDSLAAVYLDKDVVISIRFKDNFKYRVKDDVLDDILERSEVETPQWELREEPKKEPKKEIYSLNKAQELFDRYYHVLLQNSLNDHHLVAPENIKVIATNLTKEYFKALHEFGNSPWDPR